MEPDWEQAPDSGRRETFLRALRRLWELRQGPACIVETGTLRDDSACGRDGDGWSTLAWAWYCQQVGGRVYTIDLDENCLATSRRATAAYADCFEYVHSDSVTFLRSWPLEQPTIDLLYLDSLDYYEYQEEASEAHNLAEAEAALPHLAVTALILIDDTNPAGEPGEQGVPPFRGKGGRAMPFLLARGFGVEWYAGSQVLAVPSRGPGYAGRALPASGAGVEGRG